MKVYFINPSAADGIKQVREGRCMQRAGAWTAVWTPVPLAISAALLGKEGMEVKLSESGQQFDVEIVIKVKKAGFKIGEIPTVEYKRRYGKSKLSVPYHGFKVLWVIIREMFSRI